MYPLCCHDHYEAGCQTDSVTCVENQTGESAATGQWEPQFRVEKILDIKRQLAEGRYHIQEKLDVVVGRLLEDLL